MRYQEFDLFVKRGGGERKIARLRPATAVIAFAQQTDEFVLAANGSGQRVLADVAPARAREVGEGLLRLLRRLLRRPRSTSKAVASQFAGDGPRLLPVRILSATTAASDELLQGWHRSGTGDAPLFEGAEARIDAAFRGSRAQSVSWDFLSAGEAILRPPSARLLSRYSTVLDRHLAVRDGSEREAPGPGTHLHLSEYLGHCGRMPDWQRKGTIPRSASGVTIVVPTRDAPGHLRACLEGVHRSLRDQDQLVLLDHCTQDPHALRLIREAEAGGAVVCRNDDPFNFSRLVNLGAEHASCPNLVMLNNDVNLETPNWTAVMAGWLEESDVGAVGVDLRYPDGSRQHVGLTLSRDGLPVHLEPGRRTDGPLGLYRLPREVFAVTGACLGIRTALFREIGGLDERLKADFNDVALCLAVRARRLAVLWTPDISGTHKESATRGRSAITDRHHEEWAGVVGDYPDLARSDPFASPRMDLRRLAWEEDWLAMGS